MWRLIPQPGTKYCLSEGALYEEEDDDDMILSAGNRKGYA